MTRSDSSSEDKQLEKKRKYKSIVVTKKDEYASSDKQINKYNIEKHDKKKKKHKEKYENSSDSEKDIDSRYKDKVDRHRKRSYKTFDHEDVRKHSDSKNKNETGEYRHDFESDDAEYKSKKLKKKKYHNESPFSRDETRLETDRKTNKHINKHKERQKKEYRKDRNDDNRNSDPQHNFHHKRNDTDSKWNKRNEEEPGEFGQGNNDEGNNAATATVNKEEPNFKLSGKLTEYTNTYNGVVILYNEPTEARKPKTRWRLYPFKGDTALPMLQLHRQSAFLLGRDRKIADIPVDHPSCSKQHAVIQFRLVEYERPDGVIGRKVKPYVIDLDSTNGTYVNNKRIETRRYVELIEKDVVKFGFSSREYVILHEKSKDDEEFSDDLGEEKDEKDIKKED